MLNGDSDSSTGESFHKLLAGTTSGRDLAIQTKQIKKRKCTGTRKKRKCKTKTFFEYDDEAKKKAEAIARKVLSNKDGTTLIKKLMSVSDDDILAVLYPNLCVNISNSFQGLTMW